VILETLFDHYGRTVDPALLEGWENDYWRRIQAMTRVFPETTAVLEVLRNRGYRLAVITNAQGQRNVGMHRIGNYPELERYFETVIVAGEAGIPAKPDPMPFCLCLAKLDIAAAEALYVGDDWRIDIRVPRPSACTPSGSGIAASGETGQTSRLMSPSSTPWKGSSILIA
jgi:HAD superfamily hydrolase (TIGR01549 family)